MPDDLWQLALLVVAGFLAGAVNAIAGGGSMISFPALLAVGFPPVTAAVTNAVAVLPGNAGGALAYRRELTGQGTRIRRLAPASAAGALAGAALLLLGSQALFRALVPLLIVFACTLLAAQPLLLRRSRAASRAAGSRTLPSRAALAAQVGVGTYGGYFNAGVGIMQLASLELTLRDDLHRLNALKGVLSLVIGVVATGCFALFGPVAWGTAGSMALAAFAGGRTGGRLARCLPPQVLRWVVVVFGLVVATLLALR